MHGQAGTSRLFKEQFMQPIISDISAAESGNAAISCEEAVFPREDDDEEEVDREEAEIGPSICRVLCPDDFDQLLDSHTALVYLQQLKALAMKKVDPLCKVKGCGGVLDIGIKHIGSAVYLKWVRFFVEWKAKFKSIHNIVENHSLFIFHCFRYVQTLM